MTDYANIPAALDGSVACFEKVAGVTLPEPMRSEHLAVENGGAA